MDKENNNKLKKYKKKLTTKGRVDLSKGGRVKAAVGGIRKAPINRRRPPMSIQREEEPKELKPIQPVKKKPIQKTVKQVPKKAVQPVVKKRPIKPVEKVTGQPIPSGGGTGRRMTGREELERNNQGLGNQIIEGGLIERLPGETGEQYRARTAGQFTPNPNQQTGATPEEIAALKGGGNQIRPNVSNDSDRFLRNKATLAKNIVQ